MTREELLERFKDPIKVGSGGHVRLVDVMGDDTSVCQAARISYGKGTKSVSEDHALIRYLMRHRHTSPFEQCEIKFHIRLPMHVMRQLVRHRMANINEYSTRYSEAIDEAEITLPGEWRLQSKNNKQGSAGLLDPLIGESLTEMERVFHELSRSLYEERLQAGVAREQARKDLPLSTYTEIYWKCDLRNLFHFLGLRLDSHAQLEIREFAAAISTVTQHWVPWSYDAFEDYQLYSVSLSRVELEVVRAMVAEAAGINLLYKHSERDYVEEVIDAVDSDGKLSKRERSELFDKLDLLRNRE